MNVHGVMVDMGLGNRPSISVETAHTAKATHTCKLRASCRLSPGMVSQATYAYLLEQPRRLTPGCSRPQPGILSQGGSHRT